MTHPRDDFDGDLVEADDPDLSELESTLERNGSAHSPSQHTLWRRPGARFAYIVDEKRLLLFADGQKYEIDTDLLPFIQMLCDPDWDAPVPHQVMASARQKPPLRQLILALCKAGTLYPDER